MGEKCVWGDIAEDTWKEHTWQWCELLHVEELSQADLPGMEIFVWNLELYKVFIHGVFRKILPYRIIL